MQAALERNDSAALDLALRLDIMLHAYMFTLSGIPVLYAGDEIAQLNDDGYRGDPIKAGDSRYLHRGDMDWDKAERRADPAAPEGRVFRAIRKMKDLRESNRVFYGGADTWIIDTGDDRVLGIGRYYQGQKLLALFNFADREVILHLGENEPYTDLWTGKPRGASAVALPPKDFAWLALDYNAPAEAEE